MAGQPKKFKSGDMLMDYVEEFFEALAFDPDIGAMYAPTKTDFCYWLKREKKFNCDRRTLYNSIEEYFPSIKEKFEKSRADAVVRGAMQGKYQTTMSIFALKNWCGWSDKSEEKPDTAIEIKMGDDMKEFAG